MIRIAEHDDLSVIVSIYNEAVQQKYATADLEPLSVGSKLEWFREHDPSHYPIFVKVEEEEVVGWCSLSPYRQGRRALYHTAEISYYVSIRARGRGIGTELIKHAIDRCPELEIDHLFAIILDANVRSRHLLERFGFKEWGHLPEIALIDGKRVGQWYMGRSVRKGR